MADRPKIKPGDWILIGKRNCVVANVFNQGDSISDCEVVFDRSKPTNHEVAWDDTEWKFVESGDYGGYADNIPRLSEYIRILKRGRLA